MKLNNSIYKGLIFIINYFVVSSFTTADNEKNTAWAPAENPHVIDVKNFVVPEGLEVSLWASSPLFYNPTNMDIDHVGRIWITEGVNYRRYSPREAGDRVVILTDTNQDGQADKSQVFVQDPELESPLGIAVFDNVVVVSQPPSLIKYTDVDRNLKFDPKIDKKETILTGFDGRQHDHSLHSLTAGPDGKWYFNAGNCGAIFTDNSGKQFNLNGPYRAGGGTWYTDKNAKAGQVSDDGYIWTPGFTVRMNPDGTDVEIVGHGYRNSYEQTVNSFGEIFQNDNDDPPACRNSYVLEYGSAGYFTRDGKRFYKEEKRLGQEHQRAHWRQDDPGTFDVGDIYGGGSPTGVVFYENGALDSKWIGSYLSCEAGKNVVFHYKPEMQGAGYKLEREEFITSNPDKNYYGSDFLKWAKNDQRLKDNSEKIKSFVGEQNPVAFRPADITVGPDGAIYIADWIDDRVGGHQTLDKSSAGAIYRIAPKGFKPEIPQFDLATVEGQITALKSPAINVRYLGFKELKKGKEKSYSSVVELLNHSNKYIAARAIWLLPYLGKQGLEKCESLLKSKEVMTRLTAYRALRRFNANANMLPYAKQLADDPSAAIRKDVALSMRHYTAEQAAPILLEIAKNYKEANKDNYDKNYIEAIGLGSANKENAIWLALKKEMVSGNALSWTPEFTRLTWRLWPTEAINDLKLRANSHTLTNQQREFAVESMAFIDDKKAADAMLDLIAEESPIKGKAEEWLVKRMTGDWAEFGVKDALVDAGIYNPNAPIIPSTVPEEPQPKAYDVEDVLALIGDASKGKNTIMRCAICHHINGIGPSYGPALDGWGLNQSKEVVINSIVNPSTDIAHGYEGSLLLMKDKSEIHGILLSKGDPYVILTTGGAKQLIPAAKVQKVTAFPRSLMLSAEQLGLSAQDVADITAYMKQPMTK